MKYLYITLSLLISCSGPLYAMQPAQTFESKLLNYYQKSWELRRRLRQLDKLENPTDTIKEYSASASKQLNQAQGITDQIRAQKGDPADYTQNLQRASSFVTTSEYAIKKAEECAGITPPPPAKL